MYVISYLKRQWLRFKEAWKAFKREWRFNLGDSKDAVIQEKPFQIMGLRGFKHPEDCLKDSFEINPPYYGQALARSNGHVFVMRYIHYNKTTGVVRYLDTDKPEDGFVVLNANLMNQYWVAPLQGYK